MRALAPCVSQLRRAVVFNDSTQRQLHQWCSTGGLAFLQVRGAVAACGGAEPILASPTPPLASWRMCSPTVLGLAGQRIASIVNRGREFLIGAEGGRGVQQLSIAPSFIAVVPTTVATSLVGTCRGVARGVDRGVATLTPWANPVLAAKSGSLLRMANSCSLWLCALRRNVLRSSSRLRAASAHLQARMPTSSLASRSRSAAERRIRCKRSRPEGS